MKVLRQPGHGQNGTAEWGAIAVQVAILLVVIIAFVSLGTEIVLMLYISRQMQSAADAAVTAAAKAQAAGYPADYTQEALSVAGASGFINGQNGVVVVVRNPPASGNYTNASGAIEVVISQPQDLMLARVLYSGQLTVRARAVASGGGTCVLGLDPSAANAIYASNGATVTLNECGLAGNSSSSTALTVSGAATVTTSMVSLVGGASVTNGGVLSVSESTITYGASTADPYGARSIPTPGGCLGGGTISNQTISLPAGTYCSGISISHASNVTLNGIYILNNGDFTVAGGSTVIGTATIVLTGSGSNIGTVTISNGSTLSLTAPSSGATAGMVFFQSPNAPPGNTASFIGGSSVTINGAIYFPNQTVNFSNGSSTSATCTQLIARVINFTGGTTFNLHCAGTGVLPIGSQSALVE